MTDGSTRRPSCAFLQNEFGSSNPATRTGQNQFVVSNPFNLELLDHLNTLTGQQQSARIAITPRRKNRRACSIPRFRPRRQIRSRKRRSNSGINSRCRVEEPEVTGGASEASEPIIRLVNQFIETAYNMGASDIHIEPWENEVVVRYRIDGDLRIMNVSAPRTLILPIVARIKIMSNLDIAERRLPQDGRISFKKFTRKPLDFDLRVAITPMQYGEKVVMRILDKQKSTMPLQKLGFSPRHLEIYRDLIKTPYGMMLHVGPTGSGKSMTLYAALHEIQRPELNIQTAEDPIEYTLPGINQMQMHREIGLTFQRALRAYLRQDPDILLVGEIRDLETAQIAIEAALTGHLLLSTMHTNDATSSVTRLIEMGIEPFPGELHLDCDRRATTAAAALRRVQRTVRPQHHRKSDARPSARFPDRNLPRKRMQAMQRHRVQRPHRHS